MGVTAVVVGSGEVSWGRGVKWEGRWVIEGRGVWEGVWVGWWRGVCG